jgi:hypothetical protein
MLKKVLVASVVAIATLVPLTAARADVRVGIGIGIPVFGGPYHHYRYYRPGVGVYVAPAPIYVAPPPPVAYYQPAPQVYVPQPVPVQQPPVYVQPAPVVRYGPVYP